jgi:ABC-2 type transport system ATP-binding protein
MTQAQIDTATEAGPTGPQVRLQGLELRYGKVTALDSISCTLAGGRIYGLLGRNGSGKTSLLSLLAGLRAPTAGRVLVDGVEPFEQPAVARRTCMIRESGDVLPDERISVALSLAARLRPCWDAGYAAALLDRFGLDSRRRVKTLSRGQKSALGVVLGLASRSPLTIFDESYLGMDAPSRYVFYEELLRDYLEHPRTIILSTHLIEEVSSLFEEVLIIDRGRLLVQDSADGLRARGATVTGPADLVDLFTTTMTVLREQRLGRTTSATVYGELDDDARRRAEQAGLDLGSVALQDLFVYLTESTEAAA